MPELWSGPDPMRSCTPCMDGEHHDCHEFIETDPYGVHACGCENQIHDPLEDAG